MTKLKEINFFLLLLLMNASIGYSARLDVVFGTKNDPHLAISHCYHWIDEKSDRYLTYKYEHASKNKDELTFHTTSSTSNGSVAGPGLYCAKSPSGSYSYGDRLIRVDLVDDIVMLDDTTDRKYCGTNGVDSTNSSECANKNWDIKFYSGGGVGNKAWYVIQNPMAISSWSATSDQLISDLNASIELNDSSFKSHAQDTINAINKERSSLGEKVYYNQNARLSIVEFILKNPEKLDLMPPLNIVSRLNSNKSDRINKTKREEIINKYLLAALRSDELSFKDFEHVFNKSEDLKTKFLKNVKFSLSNIKSYNSSVIMSSIIKYPDFFKSKVSDRNYIELVNRVFTNKSYLEDFSSSELSLSPTLKKHVAIKLTTYESKQVNFDLVGSIPGILEKTYSTKVAKRKNLMWKNKIFPNAQSEFALNIGGESFKVPNNQESLDQYCKSAFGFAKNKDSLSLNISSSELKIFKKIDEFTPAEACGLLTENWDAIINIEQDEYSAGLFVIRGKMESHAFTLLGSSRDQISNSCLKFYKAAGSIGKVDDIDFTINGTDKKTLYNSSSYWTSAKENCEQIELALVSIVPSSFELKTKHAFELRKKEFERKNKNSKLFHVTGKIENFSYLFYGETIEDMDSQCHNFYGSLEGSPDIDDITYSINDQSVESLRNSSSYWSSKKEVCDQIKVVLTGSVPSRFFVNLEKDYKLAQISFKNKGIELYSVQGDIEGVPYIFFGDSSDSIIDQCKDLYNEIPQIGKADEINYVDKQGQTQRLFNSSSYWTSRSTLCSQFSSILSALDVPSKEDMKFVAVRKDYLRKNKIRKSQSISTYKVSGKLGEISFFFDGNYTEEINSSCLSFYENVIGTEPQKQADFIFEGRDFSIKNDYTWTDGVSFCKDFLSEISDKVITKSSIDRARNLSLANDLYTQNYTLTRANEFLQDTFSRYKVSLKIDDRVYYILANNYEEVFSQCAQLSKYELLFDQSQSLLLSVNKEKPYRVNSTNLANWSSAQNMCVELSSHLLKTIFRQSELEAQKVFNASNNSYKLSGSIGLNRFFFYGEHLEAIKSQCEDHLEGSLTRNMINNLNFGLNGKNYSEVVYERDLCETIQDSLIDELPSKIEYERKSFMADFRNKLKKYRLEINFKTRTNPELAQIFIGIDDKLEFIDICRDYYPTLELPKKRRLRGKFKLNDGKEKSFKLKSVKNTADSFCQKLESKVF